MTRIKLTAGLSFTEPPLIPLVCGAPLSSGQSPPAQSKAKVTLLGYYRPSNHCAANVPRCSQSREFSEVFEAPRDLPCELLLWVND